MDQPISWLRLKFSWLILELVTLVLALVTIFSDRNLELFNCDGSNRYVFRKSYFKTVLANRMMVLTVHTTVPP